MERKLLVLTFMDEGGKKRRLTIADPKDGLEAADAKHAAQNIIDAKVFSRKGRYVAPVKGELVVTSEAILYQA